MVSTPEEITHDSPSLPMTPKTVNKPIARKPLCLVTSIFYVKKISSICCVGTEKSKQSAVRSGCGVYKILKKTKGHSKINEQTKRKLYKCITHHCSIPCIFQLLEVAP